MIGLFYFFIVIIAGAVYYTKKENARQRMRRTALSHGRNDYRDLSGRYWWNNTRCKIDYRDGHELLVDWYNPQIVYWDYTAEKEKPERQKEEREKRDLREKKDEAIKDYVGSYIVIHEFSHQPEERCEVVTGRRITVRTHSTKCFRKVIYHLIEFPKGTPIYSTDNWLGEDISYDEFRFLTGKKYNEFNKLVYEDDPTWRIKYIRDHGYEKYFNLKPLEIKECVKELPNE